MAKISFLLLPPFHSFAAQLWQGIITLQVDGRKNLIIISS